MIISCITGYFSSLLIIKQINLPCFVFLFRIYISHNTIWSKLYAFYRIIH